MHAVDVEGGALGELLTVTQIGAYPLRPSTFAALRSRGRDVARAELLHGGRQLTLEHQGLPFGGMTAPDAGVVSYGTD